MAGMTDAERAELRKRPLFLTRFKPGRVTGLVWEICRCDLVANTCTVLETSVHPMRALERCKEIEREHFASERVS